MSKIISYSLFGDPDSFEFPFYLRGIYYNARMNRLIYQEWQTAVYYDGSMGVWLSDLLDILYDELRVSCIKVDTGKNDKCRKMLWRMMPIWVPQTTHLLCRDADAVTTYRESKSVERWLKSGVGYHGMNDDSAHSIPLMGGMIGIKTVAFKRDFPEFKSWNDMIGDAKLATHGTDQDLLMKKIYPRVGPQDLYWDIRPQHDHSDRLWESNLTCRMIGSPGVVDFELLRFFKRFDPKGESINNELRKLSPELRKHFYFV